MGETESVITAIKCTSRLSIKINETFYTVEYCEERKVPEPEYRSKNFSIENERANLWDTCNTEVDNQIQVIYKMYGK